LLDANDDGLISLTELHKAYGEMSCKSMQPLFQMFDADGNDGLDADELRNLFPNLESVRDLISTLEENNSEVTC